MVKAAIGLKLPVLTAFRSALAGEPANQRQLAVGLIGAVGELPTVVNFDEARRHNVGLHRLAFDGWPPIKAMAHAISQADSAVRATEFGG